MNKKGNYSLATFLAEHIEKENIISELFKLFNVDCITRCQFNPSVLDNLIKEFNENIIQISSLDYTVVYQNNKEKL
jgi:hypothetical protein